MIDRRSLCCHSLLLPRSRSHCCVSQPSLPTTERTDPMPRRRLLIDYPLSLVVGPPEMWRH